jgi:hypothetical protein
VETNPEIDAPLQSTMVLRGFPKIDLIVNPLDGSVIGDSLYVPSLTIIVSRWPLAAMAAEMVEYIFPTPTVLAIDK